MTTRNDRVTPEIDIAIDGGDWPSPEQLQPQIGRAMAAVLAEVQPKLMTGVSVSVLLCDDARIREINGTWRGLDKATNVLSFPAATPDRLAQTPTLGDIAIAFETVAREAMEEDKRFEDHLAHMIVHGILHLLGEDHQMPAEAERMEAIERKALARLGIADPYAGQEPET